MEVVTEKKERVALFGPWIGEFGWELMAWQARCRAESRKFSKSYVVSFPDMAPLYEDFATFIPHTQATRALDFDKPENLDKVEYAHPPDVTDQFRPGKIYKLQNQDFIKYGPPTPAVDLVIHARGINKGGKNYPLDRWEKLVDLISPIGSIASVGTYNDHHITGTKDLRGIWLKDLMGVLGGAKCVIGQSSGVMHLGALCCTSLLVWGDSRTYFNEQLDVRYLNTWNPFSVPVEFIFNDQWNPEPNEILDSLYSLITPGPPVEKEPKPIIVPKVEAVKSVIPANVMKAVHQACQVGKYLITVSVHKDDRLFHQTFRESYFDADVIPTFKHLQMEIEKTSDYKPKSLDDKLVEDQNVGEGSWM